MTSAESKANEQSILPSTFTPGDMDVIVGRGKVRYNGASLVHFALEEDEKQNPLQLYMSRLIFSLTPSPIFLQVCYKHTGNLRLNGIVQSVLGVYSDPESTKKSKSDLIKTIMQQVRDKSPEGGFVKFESDSGRWFEVGNRIAREKVSQTFRDALNDKYRSSTTSKTLKRRQERINKNSPGTELENSPAFQPQNPAQTTADKLPEAQARVDSLLMAAGVAGKYGHPMPMLSPTSGMKALPNARSFMLHSNPYLSAPRSMMPGHGMFGGGMPMGAMGSSQMNNPSSLTSYMAMGMSSTNNPSSYRAMMMNSALAQQQMAPFGGMHHQGAELPITEEPVRTKPQLEP